MTRFKPVRKAVFPVAGLGTRFLPATKAMPKEMLTLLDRPLIQYAVEEARAAGIEEFIFVTSRGKSVIEDHFDFHPELVRTLKKKEKEEALAAVRGCEIPSGYLTFCRQHKPLGLGHAIWCARHSIGNDPFAVLLADEVIQGTPCLKEMIETYDGLGGNLVGIADVKREETSRYGILDIRGDAAGKVVEVKGLVEKPAPEEAPSTLSIVGRYILQPEVLTHLERHEKGAGGEIQLTDAMARLIGGQPFHGMRFSGRRFDCGSKQGFIEANMAFALADPAMAERLRPFLMEQLGLAPRSFRATG